MAWKFRTKSRYTHVPQDMVPPGPEVLAMVEAGNAETKGR